MQRLCHLQDLDNPGSRGFTLDGAAIFAVRHGARAFVYRNRCPHLGLPLEWEPHRFLDCDGELIQCATHGARFTIDAGTCVAGPCRGQQLQAIPCELRNGELWVNISPG